jgi:hypothetical protein
MKKIEYTLFALSLVMLAGTRLSARQSVLPLHNHQSVIAFQADEPSEPTTDPAGDPAGGPDGGPDGTDVDGGPTL